MKLSTRISERSMPIECSRCRKGKSICLYDYLCILGVKQSIESICRFWVCSIFSFCTYLYFLSVFVSNSDIFLVVTLWCWWCYYILVTWLSLNRVSSLPVRNSSPLFHQIMTHSFLPTFTKWVCSQFANKVAHSLQFSYNQEERTKEVQLDTDGWDFWNGSVTVTVEEYHKNLACGYML